jgi:hypothetical protein
MITHWNNTYRMPSWLSFLLFFIGFILFFVAYVGHNWYVVPPEKIVYPPDSTLKPIKLGLFWMCVLEHCKFDLRVDYMVVGHIPFKAIQDAFQNFRTVCMVIETIAAIFCLIALALNLIFLARLSISHFFGFVAGGVEILSGVIALIGIIVFGTKFRGPTESLPFGWSYWLMLAALIILIADGIISVLLGIAVFLRTQRNQNSSLAKPLAAGF